MTDTQIDKLVDLSLGKKIQYAKKIIQAAYDQHSFETFYVAWTGGKDSTTLIWLCREIYKETGKPIPKTMFIDEGSVFEEIWQLVEQVKNQWQLDLAVVKNTDVSDKAKHLGDLIRVTDLNQRNREELARLGFDAEYFPFEPESVVGNHLMKTVAMNAFLEDNTVKALATAIRWDEQEARRNEQYLSPRTNPEHTRIHPILHFSERDIWDTIQGHNIPYCSLYALGYRSLGAKGSTYKNADIPAWEQDLENTPERIGRGQDKEAVMEQLRSLGYM